MNSLNHGKIHSQVVNMNIGNLGPSLGQSNSANAGNSHAARAGMEIDRTCTTFSALAPGPRTSINRLSSKDSLEVDSHDDRLNIMIEQDLLREHIPQQMLEVRGKQFPLNPPKSYKNPRKKRRKEVRSSPSSLSSHSVITSCPPLLTGPESNSNPQSSQPR
jgi:phenylalanyl-tRNA synthetase beta subunit